MPQRAGGCGDHRRVQDPAGRFTPQEEINDVLVRRARQGRVVVRFKGGDSFVFGRGMEEVVACKEAGVPVEVIPGVTSAVAAPELAGIPLTHRGISPELTVVTGHQAPGHSVSTLDWAVACVMDGACPPRTSSCPRWQRSPNRAHHPSCILPR